MVEERLLSLVGFALRARKTALGREACRAAARRGELQALVVAADAGSSAARDCLGGRRVPVLQLGLDKRALGALAGRETLAVLGITDAGLAAGLRDGAAGETE